MKLLSPLASWVTLLVTVLILTSCGNKNDQTQSPPARQTVRVRQASGVGTVASQSLGYSGTMGTGVLLSLQPGGTLTQLSIYNHLTNSAQ